MCGRYSLFNDKEIVDIAQIIQEVESRYGTAVNTGEIYPTNLVPVLIGGDVHPEPARWGFPKFNGSGVIINARAETAAEKPTFKTSLLTRRCAVPTTGFTNGTRTNASSGSTGRIRRCCGWPGYTTILRENVGLSF